MADKLRQMLIALVITVFLVLTTATVQAAVTYWDEHNVAHLHHSSGLTSHNCSYCYGGKAKFTAQSGDYNNGPISAGIMVTQLEAPLLISPTYQTFQVILALSA